MRPDEFATALQEGRSELQGFAESLMVDTVRIERAGAPVYDEVTMRESPSWSLVYEGPCKVRSSPVGGSQATAGETVYDVTHCYVDVPLSVPATGEVRAHDRATVVSCTHDPANAGRVFVVQRDVSRSFPVERRLFCEEVV